MKTGSWQTTATRRQPATKPTFSGSRTARKSLRQAARRVTRRTAS